MRAFSAGVVNEIGCRRVLHQRVYNRAVLRFSVLAQSFDHLFHEGKGILAFIAFSHYSFLPHHAFVAFAAIRDRFFGVGEAARATPPLSPPNRFNATAAGFFSFGGSLFGCSSVDSRKTLWASAFGSRGRVLERAGMMT